MNKEEWKSFWIGVALFIAIGVVPFFCRKEKRDEINKHTMYAVGVITKKTGSLKNGNHWHYKFKYKGEEYQSYKSTSVKYDIAVGDYYLIQFSYKDPEKNTILYEYKVNIESALNMLDSFWTKLPKKNVEYRQKKNRFW